MKSKKGLALLLIALCLVISVTIGVTVAFMTDVQDKSNTFTVSDASLKVVEEEWDKLEKEDKTVYPGRTITKDPASVNTGTASLYVYLQVEIPRANVRTVAEDKVTVNDAKQQDLFSFTANEGWYLVDDYVKEDDSAHVKVYAYIKGIVHSGEKTTTLFDSVTFLNVLEGELPMDYSVSMPVFTYGIQSTYLEASGETLLAKLKNVYEEYKDVLTVNVK